MRFHPAIRYMIIICVLGFVPSIVAAQKMDSIERQRLKAMLTNVKNTIKKEYYDTNYHGIDLDARFKAAMDRMEQVTSTGQGMGVIAQVLIEFDDSHLYFIPPATNVDVDYGVYWEMFGENCYVTLLNPKSDAAKKGLKVGDQVLSIENFTPTRRDLWKMQYYFNVVNKRDRLSVKVLSPGDSAPRDITFESKIRRLPKVINIQLLGDLFDRSGRNEFSVNHFKYLGSTTIWRMPSFSINPTSIDTMIGKLRGSNLILDLRGNGGGLVDTLERLAGFMFDKDLTIADLKGRKEMKPMVSKTRGAEVFKGKLIVLVDSGSGSAAEIFARLVQLEKRGIVIGDTSAGAVMQSRSHFLSIGGNDEVSYGVSVTNADVIMSDGKSIERTGVRPDEIIVPTGDDLAKLRDPVLARALQLSGVEITPDEAGKFFRWVWKQYQDRDIVEIEMK